jgi:hypothetical protein
MITPSLRPAVALLLVGTLALAEESPRRTLPLVTSTSETSSSTLSEEAPVDETGRPDWTSARRFGRTRIYLQKAPGEVGFEQWARIRDFRDGTAQVRFQEEIEIGLPYRFQLDIYEKWVTDAHRRAHHDEVSFEIRWAPANWGKLPLNPTIYTEYAVVDHGPNVVEFKLLLGEQLMPRLHWGANIIFERELGGDGASEFAVSQGFSYTLIDQVISAGVEMEYRRATIHGERDNPEEQWLIGPSIQLRPTKRTHLDFVALIGANNQAPNLEAFVIFGIEFGKLGGGDDRGYSPAALRTH